MYIVSRGGGDLKWKIMRTRIAGLWANKTCDLNVKQVYHMVLSSLDVLRGTNNVWKPNDMSINHKLNYKTL